MLIIKIALGVVLGYFTISFLKNLEIPETKYPWFQIIGTIIFLSFIGITIIGIMYFADSMGWTEKKQNRPPISSFWKEGYQPS